MKKIDINQFEKGIPGITPVFGSFLWEAAIYLAVLKNIIIIEFGTPKSKVALT